MIPVSLPRFALRQEHFGGLLLDYAVNSYHILAPNEYQSLLTWLRSGDLLPDTGVLINKLSLLDKEGSANASQRIDASNIRLISPPEVLPTNCLSGPIKVYDTYTRRCNLNCEHCYSSSNRELKEVRRTPEQTMTIMRKFYETGVMEWQFTGGEPTIVADLLESVRVAKSVPVKLMLFTINV